MCNFCDCLANLFGCGCNGNVAGVNNGCDCDDIETTVVCGNCQCGAEDSCCDLCNAAQAENGSCRCCNRCCSCGCNGTVATANNGCGCGCNG